MKKVTLLTTATLTLFVLSIAVTAFTIYTVYSRQSIQKEKGSITVTSTQYSNLQVYISTKSGFLAASGELDYKFNLAAESYILNTADPSGQKQFESFEIVLKPKEDINVNIDAHVVPAKNPPANPEEEKFVSPLQSDSCKGYTITRGFISVNNGVDSYHHSGVDFYIENGCPINTIGSGKVTFAGYETNEGWKVVIDHGNGVESRYIHGMDVPYVKEGDKVKAGDKIMFMGNTGNTINIILHLEIIENGEAVNPEKYIKF